MIRINYSVIIMCKLFLKKIKNILDILCIIIKWVSFIYWFSTKYDIIKTDINQSKILKNKLENLGILGIKLGQYLCTRSDITSDIMKNELVAFLNDNKIHSIDHTIKILEESNIINIDDINIGDIIGSGSLNQVYHININNNLYQDTKLVLKIKHPEVFKLNNEIYAVKKIIKFLSCFNRFNIFINIDWDSFFNILEEQIDLNNEKKFMEKYYNIFNNVPEITIPKYIMGNTDFIIMTYCEGNSLNTIPKNDPIYLRAHNLCICSSIHTFFCNNIIYGDVHEGNILVKDNGNISIIDFGICIEFNEDDFNGIYAFAKFENDPSIENCYAFIQSFVHPYDIYNNTINIKELSNKVHKEYHLHQIKKMHDTFNIISSYAKKYNAYLKGKCLLYFINFILIENLSPYNETIDISTSIAISHMKKTNFLTKNFHLFDEYYDIIMKKTPSDIIEKYNLL
jgi:predicted unusual protein kinase regulating ubiquinone biosynthesis (AarF/ABC1/UbiB family)